MGTQMGFQFHSIQFFSPYLDTQLHLHFFFLLGPYLSNWGFNSTHLGFSIPWAGTQPGLFHPTRLSACSTEHSSESFLPLIEYYLARFSFSHVPFCLTRHFCMFSLMNHIFITILIHNYWTPQFGGWAIIWFFTSLSYYSSYHFFLFKGFPSLSFLFILKCTI